MRRRELNADLRLRLEAKGFHLGDQHVVRVSEFDDPRDDCSRHQTDRTASEFQRINVDAHRVEDILEIARTHRRVVRAADLRDADATRLARTVVDAYRTERARTRRLRSSPACDRTDRQCAGEYIATSAMTTNMRTITAMTAQIDQLSGRCGGVGGGNGKAMLCPELTRSQSRYRGRNPELSGGRARQHQPRRWL
jgi:hypothetical protein